MWWMMGTGNPLTPTPPPPYGGTPLKLMGYTAESLRLWPKRWVVKLFHIISVWQTQWYKNNKGSIVKDSFIPCLVANNNQGLCGKDHNCFRVKLKLNTVDHSRLSVGAGDQGFPPAATMNVAPCYFHRKIEEKKNQKKSLAVWFPTYFFFYFEILVTTLTPPFQRFFTLLWSQRVQVTIIIEGQDAFDLLHKFYVING